MTKYLVNFIKWWIGKDKLYPDHSHYCIKELDSPSIKRVFSCQYIKVDNMIVKERGSGKVIYSGNDYNKYLATIKDIK